MSKLFGGGTAGKESSAGEVYNGYTIIAEPIKDGSNFRIAARITLEADGETKVHQLIRADTLQSYDDAAAASVAKAKQVIDEQGKRLFSV